MEKQQTIEGLPYESKEVHISTIISGDTIIHTDGLLYTVGKNNIKDGGFHGRTLFGDSYRSGTLKVKKVTRLGIMKI